MNEYTPTTEAVKEAFANEWDSYHGFQWSTSEAEGFDHWLAEVERAAAEKAVRGFVRRVSDSIEDYLSIATLDALGAEYIRAEAYRREETE